MYPARALKAHFTDSRSGFSSNKISVIASLPPLQFLKRFDDESAKFEPYPASDLHLILLLHLICSTLLFFFFLSLPPVMFSAIMQDLAFRNLRLP